MSLDAVAVFGERNMSIAVKEHRVESRYWLNPPDGSAHPRLTYYASAPRGPRLSVEFSCVKMVSDGPDLLSAEDVTVAYDLADAYIAGLGIDVSSIRQWTCSRIDYYWQWEVGALVDEYLALFGSLRVAGYNRSDFVREGVSFRNAGTRIHRRVKVYDVLRNMGHREGGILRFEVSNHSGAVRDLAQRVEGIEPRVGLMSNPDVVRRRLRYWLRRLGVDNLPDSNGDGSRRAVLLRLFGHRSIAKALYFLDVYGRHGRRAIERGLISQAQYYYWLRACRERGVLGLSDECLPSLVVE